MTEDPQSRFEHDLSLDPRLDSEAREGLTGTARADAYESAGDPGEITVAPDGRPMHEQPKWRQDFAIDWPRDHYVARREFTKFLVLTSGAFVAGQGFIAAQSLVRKRRPAPERTRVASIGELEPGSVKVFDFPVENEPCLLIRTEQGKFLAYSQKCTHLACAVVPRLAEGVLHCPCHEGYFDLETGRNIAGPPPRPLPKIELAFEGDDIFAVSVLARTV